MAFERHYRFGEEKKAKEPDVKRTEWETPAGMHAVQLELNVDTPETAAAIKYILGRVDNFHNIKRDRELEANVNFINGFIGGITMVGQITEKQADEIGNIVVLAAKSQAKHMGIYWKEV